MDWHELYVDACKNVGAFVALPYEALLDENLKIKDGMVVFPRYHHGLNFEKKESAQSIVIPKTPLRQILAPLFPWFLKHSYRKAAHFAVLDNAYDEDLESAHLLLQKEKLKTYRRMAIKYSFASFHRKKMEEAKQGCKLLKKRRLRDSYEILFEKALHFSTMHTGLKDSFANQGNITRNVLIGSALSNLPFIAQGVVELAERLQQVENPETGIPFSLLSGAASLSLSILVLKYYGYRNKESLAPENLKPFTPKERRYLLSFPKKEVSLEQRCEELRSSGFSL